MEIVDDIEDPEKPKVEKRMKSIFTRYRQSFVYTNGKITQTLSDGKVDDNITYTESFIKIGDDSYGYGTYYLNNGLVTKYVESDGHRYEEFTYEDGRIKTWKKYYGSRLEEDISFEWKDGVITRQTEYDYNELYHDHILHCDYKYSYTTDPDYGGAVAAFQDDSLFYDNLPEALIIQGYFGKWPKYLLAKAVDISGNFGTDRSYTYILDSDGYPLEKKGTNGCDFTWVNVK